MKIDSALKEFSERYDESAIISIDKISKDFGLKVSRSTINAFNINEGFSEFKDFITKYGNYKIENKDNDKATAQSLICERVENNIREEIFNTKDISYSEIPSFIESYVNGINDVSATCDSIKQKMFESGVDSKSIGDINTFSDVFIERLNESFFPTMDKILWASGYNSKKKLSKDNTMITENASEDIVFL